MGIGRDNSKDVISYVLGKYKPEETALYENFLTNISITSKPILWRVFLYLSPGLPSPATNLIIY